MAMSTSQEYETGEITYSTKRVFMRAEHKDKIRIHCVSTLTPKEDPPGTAMIVKRDLTYYGPKLRIESLDDGSQYLLTVPGPETEAILWYRTEAGWQEMAEVSLDFEGAVPQYDICLHCNEPLSTVAHRRRSAIGTCGKD